MASGPALKSGAKENEKGETFGAKEVTTSDVTGIIVGVPSGSLITIIHAESVLGAVEGGKLGPILPPAGPTPTSSTPSVFTPSSTLSVVISGVSATAGAPTTDLPKKTEPEDTLELPLVPTMTTMTASRHSTVDGTRSGTSSHASTKTTAGKPKDSNSMSHTSSTPSSPNHAPSQTK